MTTTMSPSPRSALRGVDHVAYVTWKPGETRDFYVEALNMPLVHAITAKGWLVDDYPDFAHFFFDMGRGNHIAFFYFFGLPAEKAPSDLMQRSRHIAFHVDSEDELDAWRAHLKSAGVRVTRPITHELIESIYFHDPNGIQLEITRPLREFNEADASDAEFTLRALGQVASETDPSIEKLWRRKFSLLPLPVGSSVGGAR
ncbi:VOC family protein [Leifsonia shinshuensis]